ncbi:peptidase S41-like protein [Chitinophaga dinghuensis]|uniref:Peptidase S41-like protein n=1 Tax=Chitinophaga dinghuensis TaxID=1539050 RepID=A0A327VQN7_9BACT|nr:S41 family peptidase [Chitinophaga dinghuensis]RAJ76754.1 peptidase S41-like protein [Chitinophaga dinghuensis]
MKFNIYLLTLLLTVVTVKSSYAQSCTCESNFQWLKKTFEDNDAGFKYVIDTKGRDAYEAHNQKILARIKEAKTKDECVAIMSEWLKFFRSGHSYVRSLVTSESTSAATPTTDNPPAPANWETVAIQLDNFKKQVAAKKDPGYEGLWQSSPYTMAVTKKGEQYVGVIVESGAPSWKPGMVKFRIIPGKDATRSVFYMRNFSAVNSNKVEVIGRNSMKLGNYFLKRVYPDNLPDDPSIKEYFASMSAEAPFLVKRNDNTFYLRVPSFNQSYREMLDSILTANKAELIKTKNLIIDIRNNGGGSDATYSSIIPFLYTNPIRGVGVEYYSTKTNNQRMLDFINNPEYNFNEKEKAWAKTSYEKLEQHLGEFVNLNDRIVGIDTLPNVYAYPQNVAIIINEGNGSTAEQFLLEAKQSKKVKLYGVTTYGVLDISNMYMLNSPCKDIQLGYALSRSLRIPDFTIDSKGLQPDYFIDKSIPSHEWVNFVNTILND